MKALIIIDIQNGLTNRKDLFNISFVIDTVNQAIKKFRKRGNLLIFVQHNNKQLTKTTDKWMIDNRIDKANDDLVIQKFHGNAFVLTDLETILRDNDIEEILVCGLVSYGCVKSTCLGGLSLGFKTALLKNGHTNYDKNASEKICSVELELEQKGVKLIEIENL